MSVWSSVLPMKAVILAGGLGTRISEESHLRPKPMIEIGGKPIMWHVMKLYGKHGITDFVICCGYKGYVIKEYFANYFLHMSDVTFDMKANSMEVHKRHAEPWRVTLVDTGETTQTGGRIRRIREHIDGTFCLTYGDGVSNVDVRALIAFHQAHRTDCTVTAIQPAGRFGPIELEGDRARAAGDARRAGPPGRLPAPWLLGRHGHASRQELPRRPMELRRSAMESVGLSGWR
jgi:glucose-1-phosphate cytidylyltransferase